MTHDDDTPARHFARQLFGKADRSEQLPPTAEEVELQSFARKLFGGRGDTPADWAESAAERYGVPAEALRGKTEAEINAHAAELAPHFRKPYQTPEKDATATFLHQLFTN